MPQRRLSDFILFCQDLPSAFQELIVKKKQRYGMLLAELEEAVQNLGAPGGIAAGRLLERLPPHPQTNPATDKRCIIMIANQFVLSR